MKQNNTKKGRKKKVVAASIISWILFIVAITLIVLSKMMYGNVSFYVLVAGTSIIIAIAIRIGALILWYNNSYIWGVTFIMAFAIYGYLSLNGYMIASWMPLVVWFVAIVYCFIDQLVKKKKSSPSGVSVSTRIPFIKPNRCIVMETLKLKDDECGAIVFMRTLRDDFDSLEKGIYHATTHSQLVFVLEDMEKRGKIKNLKKHFLYDGPILEKGFLKTKKCKQCKEESKQIKKDRKTTTRYDMCGRRKRLCFSHKYAVRFEVI